MEEKHSLSKTAGSKAPHYIQCSGSDLCFWPQRSGFESRPADIGDITTVTFPHSLLSGPVRPAGLCLERVDQWDINVFLVAELAEMRPLTAVTYTVFRVGLSTICLVLLFRNYTMLMSLCRYVAKCSSISHKQRKPINLPPIRVHCKKTVIFGVASIAGAEPRTITYPCRPIKLIKNRSTSPALLETLTDEANAKFYLCD